MPEVAQQNLLDLVAAAYVDVSGAGWPDVWWDDREPASLGVFLEFASTLELAGVCGLLPGTLPASLTAGCAGALETALASYTLRNATPPPALPCLCLLRLRGRGVSFGVGDRPAEVFFEFLAINQTAPPELDESALAAALEGVPNLTDSPKLLSAAPLEAKRSLWRRGLPKARETVRGLAEWLGWIEALDDCLSSLREWPLFFSAFWHFHEGLFADIRSRVPLANGAAIAAAGSGREEWVDSLRRLTDPRNALRHAPESTAHLISAMAASGQVESRRDRSRQPQTETSSVEDDVLLNLSAEDKRAALRSLETYIAAARPALNVLETVEVLLQLALLLEALAEFQRALVVLEEARRLLALASDLRLEARAARQTGQTHEALGAPDLASKYFGIAWERAREAGSAFEEARALQRLGGLHFMLRNYEEASKWYALSINAWAGLENWGGVLQDKGNLALTLSALGRAPEAEAAFIDLLVASVVEQDARGVATSFVNLGAAAARGRRFAEAERRMQAGLILFEVLGDQSQVAELLSSLGAFAIEQANWASAAEYLSRALQVARELGDGRREAEVLFNQRVLAERRGGMRLEEH